MMGGLLEACLSSGYVLSLTRGRREVAPSVYFSRR